MSNLSWHVVGGAALLVAVGGWIFGALNDTSQARQLDDHAAQLREMDDRLRAMEDKPIKPPGIYRP